MGPCHRASGRLRDQLGPKAPALLALIPLRDPPNSASAIATATSSGVGIGGLGATLFGGLIMGTGVKVAAATLGAPFWFDILQKLIGIRSAGDKPPEPVSQGGKHNSRAEGRLARRP